MIMRYINALLYFSFILGNHKYLDTLFYKNIISTNIEIETEEVFSCYLRNPCSFSKYKYWESKSKSEITTLICQY